ncbi:AAA family ATPase [Microbacterium sp. PA5]|uniref:AAA family ATPase n=1 Tax=Microbacterium sp. PA5 TaxID=3416654 RepID=UPI003CF69095
MPAQTPEQPVYGAAARAYIDAGWRGVLPLPPRQKKPVPSGFTGRAGEWPGGPDVWTWMEDHAHGNVALRLPENVIGIDIDAYPGKPGAATLVNTEHAWGRLPATWRTTSRDDGVSGIRLYTIPEGLEWPNEVGPGIEVIRFAHRYAIVWPSIHPDTGHTYKWIADDGLTHIGTIPTVDELPPLPAKWVQGLTRGRQDTREARTPLNTAAANAAIALFNDGEPCRDVKRAVDRRLVDFTATGHGARHELMLLGTERLVRLGIEGHIGVPAALHQLRDAFLKSVSGERGPGEGEAEWDRSLRGALAHVHTVEQVDPCVDPFHGLIDRTPAQTVEKQVQYDNGEWSRTTEVHPAPTAEEEAAPVGDDVDTLRQQLLAQELERQRARREATRLLADEEAAAHFREPVWYRTLEEDLQQPDEPVSYTVDQVIPTGSNVLLTAQFKTGKTTLVNNLARCLADGDDFLDTFTVADAPGRVALWNYEVDERMYRRWLRETGIAAPANVTVLNLRGFRLPLTTPRAEDWAVRWLAENHIRVWVVDPFARAFTGSGASENDNTEVGVFLDTLDIIKERAGVSELILPTHTGRAEHETGSERARGATRLDDWADVRWLLTRDRAGSRFFRATGRDVEVDEGRLDYDDTTRRLTFDAGKSRTSERYMKVTGTVISVLDLNPGATKNEVRRLVRDATNGGAGHAQIDTALQTLIETGRVRTEPGKRSAVHHFIARITDFVDGGDQ